MGEKEINIRIRNLQSKLGTIKDSDELADFKRQYLTKQIERENGKLREVRKDLENQKERKKKDAEFEHEYQQMLTKLSTPNPELLKSEPSTIVSRIETAIENTRRKRQGFSFFNDGGYSGINAIGRASMNDTYPYLKRESVNNVHTKYSYDKEYLSNKVNEVMDDNDDLLEQAIDTELDKVKEIKKERSKSGANKGKVSYVSVDVNNPSSDTYFRSKIEKEKDKKKKETSKQPHK